MKNSEKACEVGDCGTVVYARGLCSKHYQRWRTHGDPQADHSRVRGTCSIQDCDQPSKARGWCIKHYSRWQEHGSPLWEPPKPSKECSIEGCSRVPAGRGWCDMHWKRWKNHGDPNYQRPTICSIPKCGGPTHGRGLCKMHLSRAARHGNPLTTILNVGLTAEERLWKDVVKGSPDECWLWEGSTQPSGYGTVTRDGKHHRAHRFAYETLVGAIPKGFVIDHLCHDPKTCEGGPTCLHRRCCNPLHMEPTAKAHNNSGGRAVSANGRKTHCKRGHAFTPANTKITTTGGRACRRCIAVREDERAKRRRALAR